MRRQTTVSTTSPATAAASRTVTHTLPALARTLRWAIGRGPQQSTTVGARARRTATIRWLRTGASVRARAVITPRSTGKELTWSVVLRATLIASTFATTGRVHRTSVDKTCSRRVAVLHARTVPRRSRTASTTCAVPLRAAALLRTRPPPTQATRRQPNRQPRLTSRTRRTQVQGPAKS